MSRPTDEERQDELRGIEVSALERIADALERIADYLAPVSTGS